MDKDEIRKLVAAKGVAASDETTDQSVSIGNVKAGDGTTINSTVNITMGHGSGPPSHFHERQVEEEDRYIRHHHGAILREAIFNRIRSWFMAETDAEHHHRIAVSRSRIGKREHDQTNVLVHAAITAILIALVLIIVLLPLLEASA